MDPLAASTSYVAASDAANSIRAYLPEPLHRPYLGIICGSGLGGLQHTVVEATSVPRIEIQYEDVPGMPAPTVEGHEGKLVFGMMGSPTAKQVPVVLLVGRAHFYEGHSLATVTFATRLLKCLGVHALIVTNAAGGLNPDFRAGDIMLLSDHLNLVGLSGSNPLLGPNDDQIGPRFPPLSDAYDLGLRRRAFAVWAKVNNVQQNASQDSGRAEPARSLHEGTYAFCAGPSFETRAEARMLRLLGADVVGMSTVPEVLVARHAGMRVLAASLVTNTVVMDQVLRGDDENFAGMTEEQMAARLAEGKADHLEVLAEGQRAAATMVELVRGVVESVAAGRD